MLSTIVIVLLSALLSANDPPRFGWKELGQQTFSLDATEHKDLRLPKGKLRISIQAEEAVYIGTASPQEYEPFRNNKTYLTLDSFRAFHCVNRGVIQGNTNCNVNVQGAMLLVRDKRGPLTKFGATGVGTASTLRSGGSVGTAMADRATKPNRITVVIFSWQCVENCLSQTSPTHP